MPVRCSEVDVALPRVAGDLLVHFSPGGAQFAYCRLDVDDEEADAPVCLAHASRGGDGEGRPVGQVEQVGLYARNLRRHQAQNVADERRHLLTRRRARPCEHDPLDVHLRALSLFLAA